MSDVFRYHTVEALETLSPEALNALWELVPTERQRSYRMTYEREVRGAGAMGSDVLEQRVAEALLKRYVETALVPIGARWARTPSRVQEAARQDDPLSAPEDEAQPNNVKTPRKPALFAAALVVMIFGFMTFRLLSGNRTEADTALQANATSTPAVSPTPTALALEAQDDVIQGGDTDRETAYPVSLQMSAGNMPPRVWVVQRRRVGASEWNYEPNPDTASFVSGMVVRPVIGIPWSEDNALSFEQMGDDTRFTLIMNTGAALRFEYATHREVLRSDTDIFRQIEPTLVLLLIGETDTEGLLTATRPLVTATYQAEQELTRSGELVQGMALPPSVLTPLATPTALHTPIPFAAVNVQIIDVTTAALDTQRGHITTRLRLYNSGTASVPMTSDEVWLAFGYVETPPGPRIPAEGLPAFDLLPGQAADLTLTWVWNGEPYATLGIADWQFALEF